MPETEEQREARWAASRARQDAYRNSPEVIAETERRMQAGLCVVADGQCQTHGVKATMDHHFDVNPGAFND